MHCNSDISKLRKFCILETLDYFLVTIDSVLHFCVTFHNSTQSRVRAGSSVAVAPRLEMKTNFSAGLPVQQSRTAVNSVNSTADFYVKCETLFGHGKLVKMIQSLSDAVSANSRSSSQFEKLTELKPQVQVIGLVLRKSELLM